MIHEISCTTLCVFLLQRTDETKFLMCQNHPVPCSAIKIITKKWMGWNFFHFNPVKLRCFSLKLFCLRKKNLRSSQNEMFAKINKFRLHVTLMKQTLQGLLKIFCQMCRRYWYGIFNGLLKTLKCYSLKSSRPFVFSRTLLSASFSWDSFLTWIDYFRSLRTCWPTATPASTQSSTPSSHQHSGLYKKT